MSLRSAAAEASAASLEYDGDPVTFTDLEGVEYPSFALISRIGVRLDTNTGQTVQGDQTAITTTMPPVLPEEGWRVTFEDSTGTQVSGRISAVAPDRSLNRVTIFLRSVAPDA